MKNILREFLTFNKRERNGVFILLSIIFVLVLYLNISSNFISNDKKDLSALDADVRSVIESSDEKQSNWEMVAGREQNFHLDKTGRFDAERFPFDPNNLSEEDWRRLGLTDKQIRSIKKYEAKGGKFRTKEDLKKMYCIKEEQYLSLQSFIEIGARFSPPLEGAGGGPNNTPVLTNTTSEAKSINTVWPKPESNAIIELNTADSAQLTTIKGIGGFYAKNIIKYRNSIGGFISKQQLLEIWKFDAEKLAAIENYITIDPSKIKKININTCEAADLKTQYTTWTQANGIVNYRKNHGKYKTVDEIRNTDLVDEETYRKIVPYLIVDF